MSPKPPVSTVLLRPPVARDATCLSRLRPAVIIGSCGVGTGIGGGGGGGNGGNGGGLVENKEVILRS